MRPVVFRITNNLNIGGIQRRLRALLPLLLDHYEVHIITYKSKGIYWEELQKLGVHTHFVPLQGKWSPLGIFKMARLLKKYHADIVHTHSLGGNISGILAAALAGVRVRIAQVHLCNLHWYARSPLGRRKQIIEETLVHRILTHKILFVSRQSKDYFKSCTHLHDSMLHILHNGIDFKPPTTTNSLRTMWRLTNKVRCVGFVGRLSRGKGVGYFIDYAIRTLREAPDFIFFIIGSGKETTGWQATIRQAGFEEKIIFLGEKKNIQNYYPQLDLLLFTSDPQAEGMPGVVLEACGAGLPILARRSKTLEEVQDYYPRIRFINTGLSPREHIEKALSMPKVSTAPLVEEFSIETMKHRTHQLYQSLLQS
jgi:glycosyltransferase involved in cell wall biosynthesis